MENNVILLLIPNFEECSPGVSVIAYLVHFFAGTSWNKTFIPIWIVAGLNVLNFELSHNGVVEPSLVALLFFLSHYDLCWGSRLLGICMLRFFFAFCFFYSWDRACMAARFPGQFWFELAINFGSTIEDFTLQVKFLFVLNMSHFSIICEHFCFKVLVTV
jgi:hypothetical protein